MMPLPTVRSGPNRGVARVGVRPRPYADTMRDSKLQDEAMYA